MQRIELTGKLFGRLTVIGYSHSVKNKTGGYVMWKCRCSCGKETTARASHLSEGRVQSCGCLKSEMMSEHPRGQKPRGQAYLRYVFGYYVKNAKIRGFKFELDFSEFCEIVSRDCAYCGAKPAQGKNKSRLNRPNVFHGVIKHNGIDRKDNAVGYTVENSIPCCKYCNYAKRDRSYSEFVEWIKNVHDNLRL